MKEAFDELKERLEEESMYSCFHCMDRAISIVSEVEAEFGKDINVLGNGWIPCSERLPENDDDVLVWYEFKVMQGTHVGEKVERYGVGWFYKWTKSWLVDTTHDVDCRVIAWMTLPSPFKPTTD